MYQPIKLDTLVELQDRYSNVYPRSPTGARGWVRARRELPKIDPEVYIEWDKAHWRYHGERDGWTFEHHFQPVQDEIPEAMDMDAPSLVQLVTEASRKVDDERCPHCGDIHSPEEDFLNELSEAQDAALKSDGFFMITLAPHMEDDVVIYQPQMYTSAMNEEVHAMIEAQVVNFAALLFAQETAKRMGWSEGDDSGR